MLDRAIQKAKGINENMEGYLQGLGIYRMG